LKIKTTAAKVISSRVVKPGKVSLRPLVNFSITFLFLEIWRMRAIKTGTVKPYNIAE